MSALEEKSQAAEAPAAEESEVRRLLRGQSTRVLQGGVSALLKRSAPVVSKAGGWTVG